MNDKTSPEHSTKRIKLDEKQHELENDLPANEVAKLCYQAYLNLGLCQTKQCHLALTLIFVCFAGKSGKPDKKHEHTVLAAILEHQTINLQNRVVALATGTKCFPHNVNNKQESIVDCHAESLLKRAFKCYLIELIDQWLVSGQSIDQFREQGNDRLS